MALRPQRCIPPTLIVTLALSGLGAGPASAIIPVIDSSVLVQLISQIHTMEDQLLTARDQLTQAQATLQSMSGARGMENLLSHTARNYLPADWTALAAALERTGSAYGAFGRDVQALIRQNAVLTESELATLTPAQRELVYAGRRNAAALEGVSRQALANTSQRFAAIQQLIQAIGTATDQKAILDLQARIAAESGMLQNEASKLQSLYRATDAEERARAQRSKEFALDGVGSLRALPAMGL
jgi:type IV secretion system protein VirB5